MMMMWTLSYMGRRRAVTAVTADTDHITTDTILSTADEG